MTASNRFQIVPFTNPSGQTVYRVQGRKLDGTRVRLNFKSEAAAVGERQKLEVESLNREVAKSLKPTSLSAEQLLDAEWAVRELEDRSLRDAVRFYVTNYREPVTTKALAEAVEEFLEAKRRENCRPDSLTNLRIRCNRLVAAKPEAMVSDVIYDDVRAVVFREGNSPSTCDNNRRALAVFFNWCRKRGYCAANPVDAISPVKAEKGEPVCLTLPDVRKLMAAAQAHKEGILVPYMTLALFCGLRPTELARLSWDEIDLERQTVTIGAKIAKLRQRRHVALSDNAVDWLLPHAAKRTPIRGPNWRRDFDAVKLAAGFGTEKTTTRQGSVRAKELKPYVPDITRHTAISMHFAKLKHEGETAAWAGNSPDIVHRHYKGLVSEKDAESFWQIRPEKGAKVVKMPKRGVA